MMEKGVGVKFFLSTTIMISVIRFLWIFPTLMFSFTHTISEVVSQMLEINNFIMKES